MTRLPYGMWVAVLLALAGSAEASGRRPPRERTLETDGTGSRSGTPDMGSGSIPASPTSAEDMKRNDIDGRVLPSTGTPRPGAGSGTGSNGQRRQERNMGDGIY